MVCNRCKMLVKDELIKFGVHPKTVELGEVEIEEQLTGEKKIELDNLLNHSALN